MNITNRDQIGRLLNELYLFGDGAEIGCADGKFSRVILNGWNGGGNLYLIDPLRVLDDYQEADSNSEERNRICRESIESLIRQDRRAIWFPVTSEKAVEMFGPNCFDFVYLDANHDYNHASFDIPHWYEKVKPGGLFCGHDLYNLVEPPNRNCRVLDAMTEWLARSDTHVNGNLKLHHTPECTSWWIQKPR